jgi:2-methylcitrate dehydratase PrpD
VGIDVGKSGVGATAALAEFASELKYDDLPDAVAHQAKRILLDTIACIVAARPYEAAQILERTMRAFGGEEQASVVGWARRTSAPSAAFVNAELANLLDLDDDLLNSTHFANTTVTAPLAIAEASGRSGREYLQAVVAGYELNARVTLALSSVVEVEGIWPNHRLLRPDVFGMGMTALGSAAACGNVVGLSADVMCHALGIAGYATPIPTSGKNARNTYFPMNKYAAYGHIASNAVVAARLAQGGFTGDTDVLDGDQGFWRMVGATRCDWDQLIGGLGSTWWCLENTVKVYPVCGWSRHPVEAMSRLRTAHALDGSELDSVVVAVHPAATGDPLWVNREPRDHLETQLSIPYAVVMAALGVPAHKWQSRETMQRSDVRRLLDRVRVEVEPSAERAFVEQMSEGVRRVRRMPTRVTVESAGRTYTAWVQYAAGDPYTPETRLSDDELTGKLMTFGQDAATPAQLTALAEAIWLVDELDDVRCLGDLLRFTVETREENSS